MGMVEKSTTSAKREEELGNQLLARVLKSTNSYHANKRLAPDVY